jgi:hypothetical protein
MTERLFPVLQAPDGCPRAIPWRLLAPHEEQAQRNHYQSLERLAERGGLCPSEMVAVLENRRWRGMPDQEAVARLMELIDAGGEA